MRELPVRKHPRLKNYDYSQNGVYFITFCVKNKREMLGRIVGRDDLGAPYIELSTHGNITQKYIESIEKHYTGVKIDKCIVMTNHVHLIISIYNEGGAPGSSHPTIHNEGGAPGSSRPTNALIPRIITALKKYTNKEFGFDMWQDSYYDHIIRNEKEYQRIWQYIDDNPAKWAEDKYYIKLEEVRK